MNNCETKDIINAFKNIRGWARCNAMFVDIDALPAMFEIGCTAGSLSSIIGTCDNWIKKLEISDA